MAGNLMVLKEGGHLFPSQKTSGIHSEASAVQVKRPPDSMAIHNLDEAAIVDGAVIVTEGQAR